MKTEDILRMAKKAKFYVNANEAFSPLHYQDRELTKHLKHFAKLVAQHEREACAKMVDHMLKEGGGTWGDAIRARGEQA